MIVRAAFLLCRCYAVVLGKLSLRLDWREGKGREAAVAGGGGMTLGAGRSFVEG